MICFIYECADSESTLIRNKSGKLLGRRVECFQKRCTTRLAGRSTRTRVATSTSRSSSWCAIARTHTRSVPICSCYSTICASSDTFSCHALIRLVCSRAGHPRDAARRTAGEARACLQGTRSLYSREQVEPSHRIGVLNRNSIVHCILFHHCTQLYDIDNNGTIECNEMVEIIRVCIPLTLYCVRTMSLKIKDLILIN